MFFNEIFSNYYLAVNEMIKLDNSNGNTKKDNFDKVISKYGYNHGQSMIQLSQLIKDFENCHLSEVKRPLTNLEKSWLMAIKNDEKYQLFNDEIQSYQGVEPLFNPGDVKTLDMDKDGDNYSDELYQKNFQTIVNALKGSKNLTVKYTNSSHVTIEKQVKPVYLEFSEKDNKFRLISEWEGRRQFINLGRILSCDIYNGEVKGCHMEDFFEKEDLEESGESSKRVVKIHLKNVNNALERVMLQFAHCKNKIMDLDEKNYQVEIEYDISDEIEMVIRILSFESKITVVEPQDFIEKIRERLAKQKQLMNI